MIGDCFDTQLMIVSGGASYLLLVNPMVMFDVMAGILRVYWIASLRCQDSA